MNIVGTEIYGDRKQTDRLTGKDAAVISGLSHFFSVQRSDGIMSQRGGMSLTAQSPPRMNPSRREVSLTFQS
jgi:hypothetical protein